MELIKTALPRRGWSEVLYVIINIIFPTALLLLVRAFDPPYLAIALVLLSKWRVFAVQPRFWWANIRTNTVDILVGISVVALLAAASSSLVVQVLITIAYAVWLVFIKPGTNGNAVALQAGIAQFVSLTVLFTFANYLPEVVIVFGTWLIAYATARHFVGNYNEPFVEIISLSWAFLAAQLGWLLYHWTLFYEIDKSFVVPQIAVLMLIASFTAGRLYIAHKHEEGSTPATRYTFIVGVVLVLLVLLFSKWNGII